MPERPEKQIGEAEEGADSGRNQGFETEGLEGKVLEEVGDDLSGLMQDIPGVPALKPAQGDAQPGQERCPAHEQPAQCGSQAFGDDSVD